MSIALIAMIGISAAEIVFVPWFLYKEYPKRTYKSLTLKMICSAIFVAVGIACMALSGNTGAYSWIIMAALLSSVIGDFLLHYEDVIENHDYFFYGMIAFGIAHLLYLADYIYILVAKLPQIKPFSWLELVALVIALAIAQAGNKMFHLKPGKLKIPLYVYTTILVCTAIHACYLAVQYYLAGLPDATMVLVFLGGGGLLFVTSDALIGILHFGDKKPVPMRAVNIITYYAAQCLLAGTILYLGAL